MKFLKYIPTIFIIFIVFSSVAFAEEEETTVEETAEEIVEETNPTDEAELEEEEVTEEIEEVVEEFPKIFDDVDVGHPEYVALKFLKESEILHGYDDGTFKPGNLINRAEALKIILKITNQVDEQYMVDNQMGGKDFADIKVEFSDVFKSHW